MIRFLGLIGAGDDLTLAWDLVFLSFGGMWWGRLSWWLALYFAENEVTTGWGSRAVFGAEI